jgi:eukaryotic-like serine/threonine-protein kinase
VALTPGTRLGPYEIAAQIGSGGMGEVYRATDTALGRSVAIKVLRESLASDPERLARLDREARTLAALNHPNIAAIYGVEKSGGQTALIMELIEGPTLADRIIEGPVPIDEALTIAKQIAEALEAAHEQGIVHRDLKPANVKVRADGAVKVLDFGLAKATKPVSERPALSESPTMTTPATTGVGVILGTAAYMSPEQARGNPIDRRADIWAFGCVLYEMLTGRRAFDGATVSDILASILTSEPDWARVPPSLPPRIRLLVERCLEKDPKNRSHDIADARVDCQKALTNTERALSRSSPGRASRSPVRMAAALMLASAAGAAIGFRAARLIPVAAPSVSRFSHVLPEAQSLDPSESRIAVSPDGSRMAFVAGGQLYMRSLDQIEAQPVRGATGRLWSPCFSPDGQSVGYVQQDGNRLRLARIPVSGGTAVVVCDLTSFSGASWNADGTILFASNDGIWRVAPAASEPERLIRLEAGEMINRPSMLPGGDWVLFSVTTGVGRSRWDRDSRIVAQSVASGERKVLVAGGADPRYVPTGHLMYALESVLYAVRFDVNAVEVSGPAVPVVEDVQRVPLFPGSSGLAHYAVSDDGMLAYVPRAASDVAPRSLVAVDRLGNIRPLLDERRSYWRPRLSPDGTRVAVEVQGERDLHIWIVDLASKSASPLTFDGTINWAPVWAPDGQSVIYVSDREGAFAAYEKAADGSGEPTLVRRINEEIVTTDASPDGVLAFTEGGDDGRRAIWTLRLGDRTAGPFLDTTALETMPMFSPDGRWLAYVSNETGRQEVYVRPYPRAEGGIRRVSDGGGTAPVWSRDGSTLYYRNVTGALMALPVRLGSALVVGRPVSLFQVLGRFRVSGQTPAYDVSAIKGQFIMVTEAENRRPPQGRIHVIQNWTEELKRLVPTR